MLTYLDEDQKFVIYGYCEGLVGNEDSNFITLFDYYVANAQDFIFDYCKMDTIPDTLHTVIADMVVYQYRQKGVENVLSEGKGSMSQSYITEYPLNIMRRLNSHSQVKFI